MPDLNDIAASANVQAYLALVRRVPLRPIRSDADLDVAVATIDALLDRDDLNTGEQDYLDVLSDLVHRYEHEEHPMPPLSDAEMLKHLLEARGISQTQLAQSTDIAESTISAVLSGKRDLSRRHISKLSRYFGVEPNVFSFAE